MLYLGCILFGLGLGNLISLPGLIVQHEFPRQYFSRIVALIVAINQFAFAFGPGLLGYMQPAEGEYTGALVACFIVELMAAVIVILPRFGLRFGAARERKEF
jgi:MFS family permease